MRVALLGATGRTGRHVLEQALAAGHEVRALVRDRGTLSVEHPALEVIEGDATDAAAVDGLVAGVDAVISALAPRPKRDPDGQTNATQNLVAAMAKHGVRRIVSTTGAGVDAPGDEPKLFNRLMSLLLRTFSRAVLRDGQNHFEVLRQSGLDWTVARAPMLVDGPRTGSYRVGRVGVDMGAKISRGDLADFVVRQLDSNAYVEQAPVISY